MGIQLLRASLIPRLICVAFTFFSAYLPAAGVRAQGAVQAVRQRVSGLERGPEGQPVEAPATPGTASPEQPVSPGSPASAVGKLDTKYVPSTASVLLVLRPAQIMTSPMAQLLPVEVATAAGRQYVGVDPAEIEELVVFGDFSNPIAPSYGAAIKFKNPFRAAAIPPHVRPMVQLAEFNGKKYLQSAHPMLPSFYGPNNKTLLLAPDAMLRKVVESSSQPKSGKLLDRVRDVPAGSDLYLAIDVASLRGLAPMIMGQAHIPMSPDAKQMLDSIAALELTVNLVTRGPISLVLRCNDEPAAQQVETTLATLKQTYAAAAPVEQPGGDNPIAQAQAQFQERIKQRFQPQRNGDSITCLNIAAEDPLQPQLFGLVVGAVMGAQASPAIEAAKKSYGRPPAGPGAPVASGPEGQPVPAAAPLAAPGAPASPEAERR